MKNKLHDTYRRDIHDQTRLSDVTYTGLETHGTFREDLRTQALVRREWNKILHMQDSKGTMVNVLDKYMKLSYAEVDTARKSRPSELSAPVRNMFLAIWNTLGSKPKQKIIRGESTAMDLPFSGFYLQRTTAPLPRLFVRTA